MRKHVILFTSLAALAGCDSRADVDVRDANSSEVAEAVRESRVASDGDFMMRPGRWSSSVTVEELVAPGMPPGFAEQMKDMMAGAEAHESCLTPEQARKPREDFFAGKDNKCRYDHFRMGDGKIDMKMRCDEGGATQVMEMAGTYSPESYTMTMNMDREGGAAAAGEMRMKMRVDAKRVGECTGKEA